MRFLALLSLTLLLTGCGGMKPADFAKGEPVFTLEQYFAGHTKAWGLFEDRFGTIKRQFTVDIDGVWQGDTLTLDEHFLYNDGETEERVWTIKKTGDHSYTGTAGDVVGTAIGASAGNALNWRYALNLKVGDGTWKVDFDDWMLQQAGGVIINRAHVSKFGIELGSVSLFFIKGP